MRKTIGRDQFKGLADGVAGDWREALRSRAKTGPEMDAQLADLISAAARARRLTRALNGLTLSNIS